MILGSGVAELANTGNRHDFRYGSWSCKNALAAALTSRDSAGSASDQDFSHPERFCKGRRTGVGGGYALIAAISGLVPMMFMTRVRL